MDSCNCTALRFVTLLMQISMSALLILMAVTKAAPTLLDHLCVAAIMDSLWLVTGELVLVRYTSIIKPIFWL